MQLAVVDPSARVDGLIDDDVEATAGVALDEATKRVIPMGSKDFSVFFVQVCKNIPKKKRLPVHWTCLDSQSRLAERIAQFESASEYVFVNEGEKQLQEWLLQDLGHLQFQYSGRRAACTVHVRRVDEQRAAPALLDDSYGRGRTLQE